MSEIGLLDKRNMGARLSIVHSTLIKELKDEDTAAYQNLLRMDVVQFDNLLQMVYELIKKEDTQMRMVIPPKKQTRSNIALFSYW